MRSEDYLYGGMVGWDRRTVLTKRRVCASTSVIVRKLCGEDSVVRAMSS